MCGIQRILDDNLAAQEEGKWSSRVLVLDAGQFRMQDQSPYLKTQVHRTLSCGKVLVAPSPMDFSRDASPLLSTQCMYQVSFREDLRRGIASTGPGVLERWRLARAKSDIA